MNKAAFKNAFSKIKTDDQFQKDTLSMMNHVQSGKIRKQAGKPAEKGLIAATAAVCLVIAGVILIHQMAGDTPVLPTATSAATTGAVTQTGASVQTSVTQTTTAKNKIIVRSKDYTGSLVDIMRPKQGEISISPDVKKALADPVNQDKYFYVHIDVIPAEQYDHEYNMYIYNGRTIAEWTELVDLSNGTYPYSEYNGDHGGHVSHEEWEHLQKEAKTLSAQENLDTAKAEYEQNVRPVIRAAQDACTQREMVRLKDLGYDVFMTKTWQYAASQEKQVFEIFTGLLSEQQMAEFPALAESGYMIDWVRDGDGIVSWEE